MANKGIIKGIQEEALKTLGEYSEGLRYTPLHHKIAVSSGQNRNTIARAIGSLVENHPDQVVKPETGLYLLKKYADEGIEKTEETPEQPAKECASEKEFYEDFAGYLEGGLDECTRAISLKDAKFSGKWFTPDVFGTYQFAKDFGFQAQPPRIVSAEIKASVLVNDIVTGFGQACSYKIFSHKVYLVIPGSAEIVPRISALCSQFGIGLVLFNCQDPNDPDWQVRNDATVSEPHYFYVRKVIEDVKDHLKKRGLDNLKNELF